MENTQDDLHALATKVSHWSKEAASLSADLKEEALLLELSGQADRLAAAEARRHERHSTARVGRCAAGVGAASDWRGRRGV
ncbi:hypothetical protein GPECTOR_32g538 [Gonium pectorale]|uniref:Uncharacterized protein n=1 Tax=Gonium pectorale TaxID=33097 RepID=A0A150GEC1_GONPE|nr:hypothetical protein GPECTOR_32g538 [Gonium pectorale]|eukprot:KXZ47925.1 hypothetical protein GPECTOR_32g538 [Gonium pectorale]